jgi:hypothetical protein
LLYALRLDRMAIAQLLIEYGCSTEEVACSKHETFGFDAAHYATLTGDHRLLKVILSKGYHCSAPVHPIHLAITLEHNNCIEAILDHISSQIQETMVVCNTSL